MVVKNVTQLDHMFTNKRIHTKHSFCYCCKVVGWALISKTHVIYIHTVVNSSNTAVDFNFNFKDLLSNIGLRPNIHINTHFITQNIHTELCKKWSNWFRTTRFSFKYRFLTRKQLCQWDFFSLKDQTQKITYVCFHV